MMMATPSFLLTTVALMAMLLLLQGATSSSHSPQGISDDDFYSSAEDIVEAPKTLLESQDFYFYEYYYYYENDVYYAESPTMSPVTYSYDYYFYDFYYDDIYDFYYSDTDVPSASPTFEPSHQPTTAPTQVPSAVPTLVPSAVPTSAVPTPKPTKIPTAFPSVVPTVTSAPTKKGQQPPTYAPTENLGTLTFDSSLTLDGIASSTLSVDAQSAVVQGYADVIGVSSDSVEITGVTGTPSRRALRIVVQATLYSFDVSLLTTVRLSDFPSFASDPAALFTSFTNMITTAAGDGSLTGAIQSAAENLGVGGFENATSTSAGTGDFTVAAAPTASPSRSPGDNDDDKPLSDGAIAGIVIACVVAFGIILFLIYLVINRHKAAQPAYEEKPNFIEINLATSSTAQV